MNACNKHNVERNTRYVIALYCAELLCQMHPVRLPRMTAHTHKTLRFKGVGRNGAAANSEILPAETRAWVASIKKSKEETMIGGLGQDANSRSRCVLKLAITFPTAGDRACKSSKFRPIFFSFNMRAQKCGNLTPPPRLKSRRQNVHLSTTSS